MKKIPGVREHQWSLTSSLTLSISLHANYAERQIMNPVLETPRGRGDATVTVTGTVFTVTLKESGTPACTSFPVGYFLLVQNA